MMNPFRLKRNGTGPRRTVLSRIAALLIIAAMAWPGLKLFAQVGVHTDFPDASAAMEILSVNKGLLIPRVTLTASLLNPGPVTSPATGLLVFNNGSNQPLGFFYWNVTLWVGVSGSGGGSGDYWGLSGNAGTTVGTHFLGTTDLMDMAIYTNNLERMRIESDGQVVIGATSSVNAADILAAYANSTQNRAISAYSPHTGLYADAASFGTYTRSSNSGGYPLYSKNFNAAGYGAVAAGSNVAAAVFASRSAGLSSLGNDGVHAWGRDAAGMGVMSAGNGLNPIGLASGGGGVFLGYYGVYGRSSNPTGTGIVGLGNNQVVSYFLTAGSGGAFTGADGIYGKSTSNTGTGVVGFGNNMSGNPTVLPGGSGGAFTGNDGIFAKANSAATGTGIIAIGNNQASYLSSPTGSGGAFTGYHGILSVGVDASLGTGVIGAGNNSTWATLPAGSGGAFSGTTVGSAGFGISSATGVGVVGTGNNLSPYIHATGSGGSFTGNDGVYSWGLSGTGTGVVGVGSGIQNITVMSVGSGGAFFGYHGLYGQAKVAGGTGVVGAGNNVEPELLPSGGTGGAFTGNSGVYGKAITASGTGVVGLGNNLTEPIVMTTGSGGAFTGTEAGSFSLATSTTGTGIFGVGNNLTSYQTYTNGSGGAFTGTVCGVAGYATQAGSTSYGVYGRYNGGGQNDGVGVYGYSYPNNNYGIGVYGLGRKYGVFASGGFGGTGAKYFVIDHPLDPENKILKHAAIESPEVLNMYRGNVVLGADGNAVIQLPDYFLAININFSYDLTAVGQPAPNLYIGSEIDDNGTFTISGGNPGQKISWVVYAERNDLYMRQEGIRAVEIDKEPHEKGKYLMPELYNQPMEMGIYYTEANGTSSSVPMEMQETGVKEVNFTAGKTESLKPDRAEKKAAEREEQRLQEIAPQVKIIED